MVIILLCRQAHLSIALFLPIDPKIDMSVNDICGVISGALGLKSLGPLPLSKEKVSLPNFAVAYLTVTEDLEKNTVSVLLEKGVLSMQCVVARDDSMPDRIQEFLSAWKTVGMSGVSLSHKSPASNPNNGASATAFQTSDQAPGKPIQSNTVVGRLPVKGTTFSGPLDLEKNGNLIGLDHPMFRRNDEPDPDARVPDGLGDFADPLLGVKRPKHLPPNAIWEPARPDTRDPLASRSGLPYI